MNAVDAQERRIKTARENQITAQNSMAGATAQAAARAKYQGEWMMDLLNQAFLPLKPVLTWLVRTFAEFAPIVLNFGKNIITEVIVPLFHNLFGSVSFSDIFKPFSDFMSGFMGGQKLNLSGIEQGLEAVLGPLTRGIGALFSSIDWFTVGAGLRTVFGILVDVGAFAGRLLFDGINKAIGVFNVLSSVATVLYDIFDAVLAPFGGFKGILEDINPIFTGIKTIIDTDLMPAFDNAVSPA